MMRAKILAQWALLVLCCAGAAVPGHAQNDLQRMAISVQAMPQVPALACPSRTQKPSSPKTQPADDPWEQPDREDMQHLLQDLAQGKAPDAKSTADDTGGIPVVAALAPRPQRVAIWGDSHTAAAYWSDALLQHLSKGEQGAVSTQLYPANFLRPGVRHPSLRRVCLQGAWRHESAHAQATAQQWPGPGLVSMYSQDTNSSIEVDVRSGTGEPRTGVLAWRWLLHNPDAQAPLLLALSADGGSERLVELWPSDAPYALELRADQPLSRLRLRLISGHLRVQGLHTLSDAHAQPSSAWQADVFGYPGATIAAWQLPDLARLSAWKSVWGQYDAVILAYGTNEGNVKPFNVWVYRQMLEQALRNLREVFPLSTCVLVGPGDRGVLVRRSQKRSGSAKGVAKKTAAPAVYAEQMLQYSRIHAQINRVQKDLGAQFGCRAWNTQEAMGGIGAAYRWGMQNPPLMAADLLHFTAAGYQELAKRLARDLGW